MKILDYVQELLELLKVENNRGWSETLMKLSRISRFANQLWNFDIEIEMFHGFRGWFKKGQYVDIDEIEKNLDKAVLFISKKYRDSLQKISRVLMKFRTIGNNHSWGDSFIEEEVCPDCEGKGVEKVYIDDGQIEIEDCSTCNGNGSIQAWMSEDKEMYFEWEKLTKEYIEIPFRKAVIEETVEAFPKYQNLSLIKKV